MSRSYTLWFAPVVGLMGCQAPDEEFIDIEFGEDESADADDASPGDGAPNTLEDAERPTEAPLPNPDALLVSPAASWKYLKQTTCATSYLAGWNTVNFDDSKWETGRAELGYGDGDEITTISFGPSASKKCITQFFRHTFQITTPTDPTIPADPKVLYSSLVLQLLRDDGAAVYLNGELLKRDNLPSVFGINTVASSTVEDSDEDRFFVYTGLPNKLVAGKNVLAVEVHQRSASNPDTSMNLALLGRLAPNTYTTKWFVSAEATISERTPSSALGGDDECKIDGASDTNNTDGDQVCLAKWDLSSISPTATILAAHLDTDVNNGSPERFEVYKLNKSWLEFTATWNSTGTAPWATSGHFGTSDLDMTDPSPVTVINSIGEGPRIYALPPKVVQGWAGSSTAPGIAFFNTDHENGIDLDASGVGIELVVTYKP